MRLAGFGVGRASLRRAKVPVLCLLAVSLAIAPASVVAKPSGGGKGSVPSCSSLSRTAVAKLVGTGPLSLKAKVGNLCQFFGKISGHYTPMLDIQIVPYNDEIWQAAESDAKKSAAASHSTFGRLSSKLFWVSGSKTSEGLPPCDGSPIYPGQVGPDCAGEPELVHFNAIGYGPYKSGSQKCPKSVARTSCLMVSTAVSAQSGDTYLSRMILLVQKLLSGKIH
jgi:hypothetical protein